MTSLRVAIALLLLLPGVALADPVAGPTRVVEQASADTAAACRREAPVTDEQCGLVPLSPAVTQAALSAYERSSTHRALATQFHLGDDVPFRHASWLGTHNSFNTTTRPATVSGLDSNQQLSLTDQLRSDVRSVEIDAHLFPSALAGGYAPVACHARGAAEGHAGCSTEALLSAPLAEVATWVRAHPGEVVLVYLEDHLDTEAGYAQAALMVTDAFGPLLYAPGGTGCTPLPLDGTRADVLAAGKQVVVISTCQAGAGWNGVMYDDAARARDETGPQGYDGGCDPARLPAVYDDRLLRVFEDATALSATVDQGREPLTVERTRTLQRCAVDITGFDELLPGDPRLAASVWSWAPGEPVATGDCAVQRGDGWHAVGCTGRHASACRTSTGWRLDAVLRPAAARGGACSGDQVGTPRYGYEAAQLSAAMVAAGVSEAWLGLTRTRAGWVPGDLL